jgi:hypothetical protein
MEIMKELMLRNSKGIYILAKMCHLMLHFGQDVPFDVTM